MYLSTGDTPVFLVFPPEIAVPEFQSTDISETTADSHSHIPYPKLLGIKPKLFGSVQIVLGLMNFSFGVVLLFILESAQTSFPFVFLSGYPFWSSILFINSGAFLIALERQTTETLVKLTWWMSLLSTLGAMAGIVLLSFTFVLDQNYLCGISTNTIPCQSVTTLFIGILIMLTTFAIVELFISVTMSILSGPCHCCDL